VGTQNFPPIFELFTILDCNFPKIVAPPSNKNENYLSRLKRRSLPEKTLKTASKSTHKQRHKPAQSISPRMNSAPASEHDKQEAQLMLTTGSTHLAVSRGQQTWYHFRSIATFR